MYACFITFFFSVELGLACSASLAQEGNFTFHAGGGSKWPQSPAWIRG